MPTPNFVLIDNQNCQDATRNLALEEYLATQRRGNECYLFLYVNRNAVILGKNQNTLEEINYHFAKKNNIQIVRRISGGGTVYHDAGNLNYSLITPFEHQQVANWKQLAQPILQALNQLGVPAQLNYRSDIIVHQKKVSGTAQYTSKNAMISHGTLLFESNLDVLEQVLHPSKTQEMRSKSLKSFRSKVLNINELLGMESIDVFKNSLIQSIFPEGAVVKQISDVEWEEVNQLARQKYQSWAWNFGRSPAFKLRKKAKDLEVEITVARGGNITAMDFNHQQAQGLATDFVGKPYAEESVIEIVKNLDSKKLALTTMDKASLIHLLY